MREEFQNIYNLLAGNIDDLNVLFLSIVKVTGLQPILDNKLNTSAFTWAGLGLKPILPPTTAARVLGGVLTVLGPRANGMTTTQVAGGDATVVHTLGHLNYTVNVSTQGFFLVWVIKRIDGFTIQFKKPDASTFVGTIDYDFVLSELTLT